MINLPSDWNLPEAIRRRLGDRAGRQRTMFAEGHLLIILHAPPREDTPARKGVYFWRDAAGTWKSTSPGEGIDSIRKHLRSYAAYVDDLDAACDRAAGSDDYHALLQPVIRLKRAAKNMHGALQAAREALPDEHALIVTRDRAYEIERAAVLLHDDTANGLAYAQARQAEKEARHGYEIARAGHRLNILVAIFLPPTAVASIFGMKLDSGLEGSPMWVFWTVLIVTTLIGVGLAISMRGPAAGAARPPQHTRDNWTSWRDDGDA